MLQEIQVDYNARTAGGREIRAHVPVSTKLKVGDNVVIFEPSDESEADAVVTYISPDVYTSPLDGGRTYRIVHLLPELLSLRDRPAPPAGPVPRPEVA